jgi:hypothetical protein
MVSASEPGQRSIARRRAHVDPLASCPMKYRAHIFGTEDGRDVDITGEIERTEAAAILSAQTAAWSWLAAGQEKS